MRALTVAVSTLVMMGFCPAAAADPAGAERGAQAPDDDDDDDDDEGGVGGFVALGPGMVPEYPGSKDYQLIPFGLLRLQYGDFYIEAQGPKARINVIPSETFQAGPMIGYDFGRDSSVKNKVVDLLPKVKTTVEAGGFARFNIEDVLAPRDSLEFEVTFLKALKSHKGYVATVGASYGRAFTRQFYAAVDAELAFSDKKRMNAYFGVSAPDAAISGLSSYRASSGISGFKLGTNARYMFDERWGVVGRVSYERLLGDASDSPITKDEGSPNQFMGGIGVVFAF